MSKLAIVSSYSESCGNASFTKVLHDSIELYSDVDVEVVELDLKLLQSANPTIRKKGDKHVEQLAERLKAFDAVNLQFEAGLFGTLPADIVRRTSRLMAANSNTTVTLHSPRLMESTPYGARSAIKKLMKLQFGGAFREFVANKLANVHIEINRKVIRNAVRNNLRLIVHTVRAQRQIEQFFNYTRVDVHPLKIIPDDFSTDGAVLEQLRSELRLAKSDTLIGMFGYISAYKGHSDALKAMTYLPNNYKLLIFGRQHPQTLKADGKPDRYLNELITTVTKTKALQDRVFFIGELDDDAFWQVAGAIDIAWLPYYENGQDGSGIASICMDACKRVLCSSSFAFDELFKLVPYSNYLRFDIGNYLEIATKTEMLMRREVAPSPMIITSTEYSYQSQAFTYVRDISGMNFHATLPLQAAAQ
ncbi:MULTISPECIES: glycosyltransferase [Rhizobium]|uniref:Glycosyltransferase involved in cell wall biosynthesis n=1 Tax=Rhizobium paranaense TaxID=1650438 RepID=A0A7W9D561_9HYPH|nr:glycosyltransferase [Rhizobium paranaense]MBB5577641.1 glycosyltransferase involved in cell wall biosynthesis [Rhizobium paranaense]